MKKKADSSKPDNKGGSKRNARKLIATPRKTDASATTILTASARKYQETFYKALSIDSSAVASTPKISHILNSIPGGIHKAIEYIYGSEEPEARAFVTLYDEIMATPHLFACILANAIPFEAFCVKLNIPSRKMLELVTGACFEQSSSASALLAAASHPIVTRATVEAAMYPDGHQDRKLMHQHARFIPTPKNTVVAPGATYSEVNDNSINKRTNQVIAVSELAKIETTMSRIADRFNERMGISEGSATPVLPPSDREFSDDIPEPIEVESEASSEVGDNLEPTESDWSL